MTSTPVPLSRTRNNKPTVPRLDEGGRLGLKCLLLSYFRVGHQPPKTFGSALDPLIKSGVPW